MRKQLALLLGAAAVLAFAARPAAAQNRAVTGQVVESETRQGISSAQISVVGGRQGTAADDQGRFRINLPASAVTLDVRALGYKRIQVPVPAGQTTINIRMEKEALQLSEVVVTGAATTEERRNVATAVSTVAAQTVAEVPAASLDNALQGKVVGTTIQMNSGAPGGGGQVQIRGVTTILGNGDPLYVVDGVIISNATISPGINAVSQAAGRSNAGSNEDNAVNRLADLNPDEIESVQVLKSAAASAIYGSLATNGVVLITTKRGHSGAATFNWSQTVGQSSPERLLGSRHFNNGTLTSAFGGDAAAAAFAQQLCPGSASTACPYYDDQGALYGQRDLGYETNINMSGGSDQTKYYAAAHDKYEPGTLMNTDARRQDLRLNLDQTFGDRWTANASAGLYRSISDRGISNNDNTFTSPIYGLAYDPAVFNMQQKDASGHYINEPVMPFLFGKYGSNPFQLMQGLKSEEDVWRQIGSGTVKFAAYSSQAQTVTLQAQGGFDTFSDNGQTFAPAYLETQQFQALPGRTVQVQGDSRQVNGTVSAIHTWTPGSMLRQLTSATTSFGLQYEERYLNQFSVLAQGLIPGLQDITQGSPTLAQTVTDVRDQAFYANEEVLAFNEKLSVSGRIRGERSSVNGDPNKFYYWPAASLAYHIPNFIPGADDIKLRGAIGLSGNQPIYGSRDVTINPVGIIGGQNALSAASAVGNPNIRPEQMQEDELGVDATFAQSRIGFEGSVFRRDITQLLLQATLAPSSGQGTEYINGGHMQTKGLELGLNLFPIRNRTFTWTSNESWYSYSSMIVSIPVNPFVVASSGFGAQFGHSRIQGGYRTTEIWGNLTNATTGKVAEVPIADANPKFQMGFNNDFQWKDLTLTTLVDWKDGGYVSDMTNQTFDEGFNSWDYDKPCPASPSACAAVKANNLGSYRYNTWAGGTNIYPYIQNGSYVKLREVTLAYRLPQQASARFFGGHDARVEVSGRNLFMSSPYWGFDPEVSNFGDQQVSRFVDLEPYPPTKSFYAGFNVSF